MRRLCIFLSPSLSFALYLSFSDYITHTYRTAGSIKYILCVLPDIFIFECNIKVVECYRFYSLMQKKSVSELRRGNSRRLLSFYQVYAYTFSSFFSTLKITARVQCG